MDQLSAHLDRGWDLVSRGDFDGAWTSAQKILELNDQCAEAHNLLGYIRAAQGDVENALEHYRHAIDLDDSLIEAKLNAAEVLIHPLHHFEEAIDLADEALDVARESDEIAEAMLLKIDALLHQGDMTTACRVAKALPTGPFETSGLGFLVGRAKFEVGDISGAEPLLHAAVQDDPANSDVAYHWALLLASQDKHAEARTWFLASREADQRSEPWPWSLKEDIFKTHAHAAIEHLSAKEKTLIGKAALIIADLPGAEVVAEGVDPRTGILLERSTETKKSDSPVNRVFIYQRNIERIAQGASQIENDIAQCLQQELNLTPSEPANPA